MGKVIRIKQLKSLHRMRFYEPDVINALKEVCNNRFNFVGPNITKKVGRHVPRSIKREGFYIKDGMIALKNPKFELDFKPAFGKRKGIDFYIKSKL